MVSSLRIDARLASTVCCCRFRRLATIAVLELGQNRTHFANGARSRSFPCEPITRGRMECAPSIRPRVIGSQGNDLLLAPFAKCVLFCPNSNTAIVASLRKRQQQTVHTSRA